MIRQIVLWMPIRITLSTEPPAQFGPLREARYVIDHPTTTEGSP